MQKYLEFSDGSSHKFWSIQTEDNSFTVVFGKAGAAGQTQTKTFATPEEAEKEANKQAASKIKKGYAPATPPEGFGAAAKDAVQGGKSSASAKPKAEAAPKIPKDVADDGTQKPWHLEDSDFWEYSWHCPDEEEMAVEALRSPSENEDASEPKTETKKPPKPEAKDTVWYCWDNGRYEDENGNTCDDDDDDVDGFNVSKFSRMAVR